MSHYTESFNRLVMNTRITLLLISFVVLNFENLALLKYFPSISACWNS